MFEIYEANVVQGRPGITILTWNLQRKTVVGIQYYIRNLYK